MTEKDSKVETLELKINKLKEHIKSLKLKQNEKNQFLITVISNLNHELRTPLNGILGFSEILNTSDVSIDEMKLYAGVIEESSLLLMSILNDTFDIARIDAGNMKVYPELFDLNDLLFELFVAYKEQAESAGLQLFLENLVSEPFVIESSPDVIKRVLMKLLDNAIKFTKQGWIKISFHVVKEYIHFSIEDTGIGIEKPVPENLFSSFIDTEVSKSRKVSGTGIDLSLCKGLVELIGGKMKYESKSSGGSIFHFSFLNFKKQ